MSRPEDFGAIGDGVADDTAAVQSAVNADVCELKPKASYRLTSQISIPQRGSIYDPSGTARLLVDSSAGGFDNTDLADRFATNGCALYAYGVDNIRLGGFRIERAGPDTAVRPIAVRNVHDAKVEGVEVSGFGICAGGYITFDTVDGLLVQGCRVIDCHTDEAGFSGNAAMSAISLDGDRVGGVGSRGARFIGNAFRDLTTGPNFQVRYGDQMDAIEFCGLDTSGGGIVEGNVIDNVNEGVDVQAWGVSVVGNSLRNIRGVGIKLIHGSQRFTVAANSIQNVWWAGIALFGSFYGATTGYGTVAGNSITLPCNSAGAPSPRGGIIADPMTGGTGPVAYTTIIGNMITGDTATMQYGFVDASHPSNQWLYNQCSGYSVAPYSVLPGASAARVVV